MYATTDWPSHRLALPATIPTPGGQLNAPGGSIWIHDTGPRPDNPPTIVLIGGYGLTVHGTFEHTITTLAAHHRLIGLDHAGHGNGRRYLTEAERQHDLLELSELDIIATLAQLQIDRVTILAYSAGAAVAQLIARDAPHLIDQLIIAGGATRYEDRRIAILSALPTGILHGLAPTIFRRVGRTTYRDALRADWEHGNPWLVAEFGRDLAAFDSEDWACTLPPTNPHVIVFEYDQIVPKDDQIDLARQLHAPIHWAPVGHLAPMIRRDRPAFMAALSEAVEAAIGRPTA